MGKLLFYGTPAVILLTCVYLAWVLLGLYGLVVAGILLALWSTTLRGSR